MLTLPMLLMHVYGKCHMCAWCNDTMVPHYDLQVTALRLQIYSGDYCLGAVPSAFVVLCSILENHRSKKKQIIVNDRSGTVHRQGQSTDELMESAKSRLIGDIFTQRDTWINLMVTGGCWFLYDVAYCKMMVIVMMIMMIVTMHKKHYRFDPSLTYSISVNHIYRWIRTLWWRSVNLFVNKLLTNSVHAQLITYLLIHHMN